jgi:hypothetical protein
MPMFHRIFDRDDGIREPTIAGTPPYAISEFIGRNDVSRTAANLRCIPLPTASGSMSALDKRNLDPYE